MIHSKSFVKEPNNNDSHPLAECYAWAMANCVQTPTDAPTIARSGDNDDESDDENSTTKLDIEAKKDEPVAMPMLVFVEEYRNDTSTKICRRFVASTLRAFLSFYEGRGRDDKARHIHEVVGLGPCKAYCDFELYLDRATLDKVGFATPTAAIAALETSSRSVIGAIVDYHQEHGVAVRPQIMISHKATKWSKHVVFVDSLWLSAQHFGRFMKGLKQRLGVDDKLIKHYVDPRVYDRFHCLRMYRSSKLEEPDRSMLAVDEHGALLENARSTIDRKRFFDSLITLIVLPPLPGSAAEAEPEFATTAFLERFPDSIAALELKPLACHDVTTIAHQIRSSRTVKHNTTGESTSVDVCSPIDFKFEELVRLHFARHQPYQFRWIECDGVVRVECRSQRCEILGAAHSSNHIFIELDVLRQMWRCCCYSERCRRTPTDWRAMHETLMAHCLAFVPKWRYNERYLVLAQL